MADWLERGRLWLRGTAARKEKKSHNKLIGHSLIVCFSLPPSFLSLSTGQHTEEGHCSAHSGEERAAGGPEGEERRYCTSQAFKFTSPSPFLSRSKPENQDKSSHISSHL